MSTLRENVIVTTPSGPLNGELFIGADGFPEVSVATPYLIDGRRYEREERFTVVALPANWIVTSSTCGPLYSAWDWMRNLMEELAVAQREAEAEDRDRVQQRESDDIEAYKRDAEARGAR